MFPLQQIQFRLLQNGDLLPNVHFNFPLDGRLLFLFRLLTRFDRRPNERSRDGDHGEARGVDEGTALEEGGARPDCEGGCGTRCRCCDVLSWLEVWDLGLWPRGGHVSGKRDWAQPISTR